MNTTPSTQACGDNSVDCPDLSIIIPFKADSPDRLENLKTTSRYIDEYFMNAEKILIEFSDVGAATSVPTEVAQRFDVMARIESNGPFAKSLVMNEGLLRCSRSVVACYDVDVLVHPMAAQQAIKIIMSGRFPVVIPFNGTFIDVCGELRKEIVGGHFPSYLFTGRSSKLVKRSNMEIRFVDGGVLFADRQVLLAEGGFNKKMISYGWEDIEVPLRLKKLGYYSKYLSYNLVHLNHARGPDSQITDHFYKNHDEYKKVKGMSRRELQAYVDSEISINDESGEYFDKINTRKLKSKSGRGLTRILAEINKIKTRLLYKIFS